MFGKCMPNGLIYLYRIVFAYLLLPPSLLPRYVFFRCVCTRALPGVRAMCSSCWFCIIRVEREFLMAKYRGNASIPVPAHCCMCVRREKLEVRMSPWSRGGSLVPTLPSTTSVNRNFTFVATPQCVNGRWDADGYLTSHRDSGGEACIVMGDILLGH